LSISTTVTGLRDWLLESTGEKLSPDIFDARQSPRPNTPNSVSIHLRSNRDTGLYRNKTRVRHEGVLRVGIVQEIKLDEPEVSEAELYDRVQAFVDACGPQGQYPVERMEFGTAVYSTLPGREHYFAEVDMPIEFVTTRSTAAP
jgi:hypothetical protein